MVFSEVVAKAYCLACALVASFLEYLLLFSSHYYTFHLCSVSHKGCEAGVIFAHHGYSGPAEAS